MSQNKSQINTPELLREVGKHGNAEQVRERLTYAIDPNSIEAVMAIVARILAARDAAVERALRFERERNHATVRAERAEAEIKRLAAARLVLAVFGVPEEAPQPFSLCRDSKVIGLGVQWPGGAVTIKWTPPDRLATVTSHSLEDALAVHDPDSTLGVVWLSEDLGTLAEAEDRILAVEKLIQHREQRYADGGGTTIKAIPVADLQRAIGMEGT